ncbi:MAG: UDP-N-acetylglucosamine--N-acetylmuramyl-(pentapeptide) pyrophosphoryl-undecaprenol N-acetylglucosamine transferase [Patescibacteria group bacterium]
MKILFTGGGTAGHVAPIIALAREIRKDKDAENFQFFYIGPKDEFSSILLSQEGIKTKNIMSGKIRRYSTVKSVLQNLVDIFIKIPFGIIQAFLHIFLLAPDLIIGKGGFGSLPTVLAGWVLRTPIFLHESDVVPSLTNKILGNFALEIFVSFPNTEYFKPSKMILVGNPIRKELLEDEESSTEEIEDMFGITSQKSVILIFGGSQGSKRINDLILDILPQLLETYEIIHQTGVNNFQQVKAESAVMASEESLRYYHPFPFFQEQELKKAYKLANLIISRAGSGAIFEIAVFEKPSILIPLPESAQNHQVKNAYSYAESGASQVLEEPNFQPHFLLEKLKYFFSHPDELEKMKKGARSFAKPKAAEIMAEYIIEYLLV